MFFSSDGNEKSEERRLEEGSSFRPIRSADPERRNKNVKKQKQKERRTRRKMKKSLKQKDDDKKKRKSVKQKNGKREKAGKSSKRWGGKRKEGKGKGRKKSTKGKNLKEKRKGKKGKKSKKRKGSKKGGQNRSKKEKKENSIDKGSGERLFLNPAESTSCGSDVTSALACHDAAVDYMKLLNRKVCTAIKYPFVTSSSLILFHKSKNVQKLYHNQKS